MAADAHGTSTGSDAGWLMVLTLTVPLVAYLAAAGWQYRMGRPWSFFRTVAFAVGIVLLAVATSPPVAEHAHHHLRGHMVQHLLIGMFAPLALVLAAPVTLLLRAVPVRAGRKVASVLRSPPMHLLGHPVTAMTLNVGGMHALYLTPLYAASLSYPVLHTAITVHFLAAGYLFAWSIAGPDPAPRRPGMATRVTVLITAIAAHAILGKLMYAHLRPRGTPFSTEQIQDAAELMYYGGDLAELLLAVALFATWYGQRRRARQRMIARTGSQKNGHPQVPVVNVS